jgi:uncharacterized protein
MPYEPRFYRDQMDNKRFKSFVVKHLETDLWVGIDPASHHAEIETYCQQAVVTLRNQLDNYIKTNPLFRNSLAPLPFDNAAPSIAKEMLIQSQNAGVGPMACVAGAFSHFIGFDLINRFSPSELVIENGGDNFILVKDELKVAVYAGKSPLSEKIGICIIPDQTPLGVCTSSASVGPSLSLGKSDATMIVCKNTALADGYASNYGNKINLQEDIKPVIEQIKSNSVILSAIIVYGEIFGICGKFKLELFK